jgi:hypothetical protein
VRRSVLCVVLALLTTLPLLASHQRFTDAERDGFNGAVRSAQARQRIHVPASGSILPAKPAHADLRE